MPEKVMADEREYLRLDKRFPSLWCPGCGIGSVLKNTLKAASAAPIVAGMFRRAPGGAGSSNPADVLASIPGLKDLLDLQTQRVRSQQPLFDALTRLGMNVMPTVS